MKNTLNYGGLRTQTCLAYLLLCWFILRMQAFAIGTKRAARGVGLSSQGFLRNLETWQCKDGSELGARASIDVRKSQSMCRKN